MSPSIEHALATHAAALRSLARDLVGADAADDVLQDTALQALQKPPRRDGELRGWLARIVQRLALRHRRSAHRRSRHESGVEQPLPQRGPGDEIEHRDTIRHVTDAVLALPAIYQRALLLRYFEELTPTAIAERTGEALGTVKSRLARGLQLLRERLDAGKEESDWRAALGALLGLRRSAPVGTAVAAATGVMLMGTGVKLVLGVGAAVAVAAAWWCLQSPAPAVQSVSERTAPGPLPVHAAVEQSRVAADTSQRAEVALPATPASASSPVSVRGRVVDVDRVPIAGAQVRYQLFVGSSAATRDAGGADDAAVPSDQDGRFAFPCPATSGDHLQLDVRADGYCPLHTELPMAGSGGIDLGELALATAIHLRGRVVDDQGRAQSGVALHVSDERTGQGLLTDPDGRFATKSPLRPGRASLIVDSRSLVDGNQIELQLDAQHRLLEVEVTVRSDEPDGFAGIVVDDGGAPIERAQVRCSAGGNSIEVAKDGRFVMPVPAALGPGPFRLQASAYGHEDVTSALLPRGTREAKLVLQQAPDLLVRVVAADTRQPVSDFRVLLLTGPPLFDGHGDRSMAHHPDGLARIRTLAHGDCGVWVEAGDEDLAPSTFVPVHIGDAAETEVLIALERRTLRTLRVQDSGGRAMASVEVELIDAAGQPLECHTCAVPPTQRRFSGYPYQAQLLQRGSTDDDGELQLRGPGQRPLSLRLHGGGASLQIARDITLSGSGPLLVTAERGARWRGRLVPEDVARSLFAMVANDAAAGGLRLSLSQGPMSMDAAADPPFPIDADGSYRIDCIPAGVWQVDLHIGTDRWPAGRITVVAGATLEQDLDVAPVAPLHLELQTFVDGKPLADGVVDLVHRSQAVADLEPMWSSKTVHTDGDGKAAVDTFAGQFLAHVHCSGEADRSFMAAPFVIRSAGRVLHVLDISLADATLQLQRADGTPAAGVELSLSFADFTARGGDFHLASDAAGRLVLHRQAAGARLLRARPRTLGTAEAQQAFALQHGWQALHQAWIDLPPLVLQPGTAATPIEIRLPPEWDR